MSTVLKYEPEDAPLFFVAGDNLNIGITFSTVITDRTFTAGVSDGKNTVLIPMSIQLIGDYKVVASLNKTQTASLKTLMKQYPDLKWFFTQAISGVERTLFSGKMNVRLK